MYSEKQYIITIKDAYRTDLDPAEIELLINSTFNNLRVEVSDTGEL